MHGIRAHFCPGSKAPCSSRSPLLSKPIALHACHGTPKRPSLAVAFHGYGLAEYVEPQAHRNAATSSLSRNKHTQQEEGDHTYSQQPLRQPQEGARSSRSAQPLAQQSGMEQAGVGPIRLSPQHAPEQPHTLQATAAESSGGSPPIPATHPAWFDARKQAASLLTREITACSTWQELEQLHQQRSHEMDFIHLSAMLNHLARLITHRDQGSVGDGDSQQGTATTATGPASQQAQQQQQQQQQQQPLGFPEGSSEQSRSLQDSAQSTAIRGVNDEQQQQQNDEQQSHHHYHQAGATSSPIVQLPQSGMDSSNAFSDAERPLASSASSGSASLTHSSSSPSSSVSTATGQLTSPPLDSDAPSPPLGTPPRPNTETSPSLPDNPSHHTPTQAAEHAARLRPDTAHHAPTELQGYRAKEGLHHAPTPTYPSARAAELAEQAEHAGRLHNTSLHHHPTPLYPPAPRPLLLARQLQQELLGQLQLLRPREAANCLWALARLQLHFCEGPEGGVTEPLLHPAMAHQAWRHARNMGPQELSSVLYSSARLGLRPPSGHLIACLRRLGELCRFAQPQALANSVWALGKMGVAVPPNMLRRLLQASYRDMYQFTPQGLVCLVYGFATMGNHPVLPKAWQLKLLDASWRFMRPDLPDTLGPLQAAELKGGSNSSGASSSNRSSSNNNSIEAQVHKRDKSLARGRADAAMGLQQKGPIMHASTLIRLLQCLVLARAFPSKPWLAECFAQVEQQAHALNTVDVVDALWALGQMRSRPPVPLLALLMHKAYVHMAELPVEALVGVIWAAAQLRARPSVPWAERFLRLAFRSRDRMTPRMVANILLSLARLNLRPNRRFVHSLLLSLRPHLVSTAGGADTVQLAMALPALKHGLPAEMVPEFQHLIDAKLPRLRNPVARGVACKGWASLGLHVEEA